ncbi:hypothetical protein N9W34_07010, partial [Rickettsiales bacterium]|nr:hypothetical protein [Rickettsiales bacterium]
KFTGQETYIYSGYPEYGGAIKGHAALGYYWEYMEPVYNKLKILEKRASAGDSEDAKDAQAVLSMYRRQFLVDCGIERPYGIKKYVDSLHLAIWMTYKDKPMICPSSGSFAFGFLQTLSILRNSQIHIGTYDITLLGSKDGSVIPWIPIPNGKIMPLEKLSYILEAAKETKCEIAYWEKDRDLLSFIDTLEKGGFYCSTNPKSIEEVLELIKDVEQEKGLVFLEKHKDSLANMGVILESDERNITITVTRPMMGSVHGLMSAKLEEMELLYQNPDIKAESTFNQPSAGSTLAASAMVNMALANPEKISDENKELLAELFPNIYSRVFEKKQEISSDLYGCFDVANSTLANDLGYDGVRYEHNKNPVNGLGAFSSSQESVKWLKKAAEGDNPTFGGDHMLICPHNFMEIARVMIFASNVHEKAEDALYPESAGAAGLGGWLHKEFVSGNKTARDIAYFLRKNGVNSDIFESLVDMRYFKEESNAHGADMAEFTEDFLQAMSSRVPIGSLKSKTQNIESEKDSVDKTGSSALIFYNTGSNGTERFRDKAPKIKEEAEKQQQSQRQRIISRL